MSKEPLDPEVEAVLANRSRKGPNGPTPAEIGAAKASVAAARKAVQAKEARAPKPYPSPQPAQ